MTAIQPFTVVSGRVALLPRSDIDTDQIIPKQFLTRTARTGWAEFLFHDWRYDGEGRKLEGFPLNDSRADGATVLIAGENFGCGSSREHAVWALQQFGIRAVIAGSFADIFENNALRLGLLPVRVESRELQALCAGLDQGSEITVDLLEQVVDAEGVGSFRFAIDPYHRESLLRGVDEIGMTLDAAAAIDDHERTNPARVNTTTL